jgi:hypothetical protein
LKRFIPPILLGGFIVALFVAIQGGGNIGLAGQADPRQAEQVASNLQAPPESPVWECIAITQGDAVNDAIVLETANFGFDYVVVNRPEFFCEAIILTLTNTPPTTTAEERILVCYSIRRGDDPDDPAILDSSPLFPVADGGFDGPPDVNTGDDVQVRRSTHFCEEGTKALELDNTIPGTQYDEPYGELGTDAIWQCFTLEQGQDPNDRVFLWSNNFGMDQATVRASSMFCEPAVKCLEGEACDAGTFPEEEVLQCFRVPDGHKLEEERVLLETDNFGEDAVQMRNTSTICAPATKISSIELLEITLPTTGPAPVSSNRTNR